MFDIDKGCPHIIGLKNWKTGNERYINLICNRYKKYKTDISNLLKYNKIVFDLKLAYRLCRKHGIFLDLEKFEIETSERKKEEAAICDVFYNTYYPDKQSGFIKNSLKQ